MKGQPASKDALRPYLQLRQYVAGRVDLSNVAKLIDAVLVDFTPAQPRDGPPLDPEDLWIAPTLAMIGARIAMSPRHVRRGLRDLEDAGLHERRRRRGHRPEYRVLDAPPLEPDMTGVGRPGSVRRTDPSAPPGKAGQIRPQDPDRSVRKTRTDPSAPPPTPPPSSPRTRARQRARAPGSHLEPRDEVEIAALETARKALYELTRCPLHARWVAAILKDCRVGAAAIWIGLTTERLDAARQLASRSKRYRFGPWAVQAEHADRTELEADTNRQQQRVADQAAKEEEDRQRQNAHLAERDAYFEALPIDKQTQLVAQCETECRRRVTLPPETECEVILSMARSVAWNERKEQAP